jgi:histidyl-tRNA synthetase
MKYQCPPGMKDLVEESSLYRKLEEDFFNLLLRQSFTEIRTPILENKDLFIRSVGESSDIVKKEMFVSEDLVLRPENTASILRAYLNNQDISKRLAYFAPQFRKERPQKGRLRQFYQYGFEILEEKSPQAEIEALTLISQLYQNWGLKDFKIQINFLGNNQDRENYKQALVKYFSDNFNQLSSLSQERLNINALRILDSKEKSDQDLVLKAPKILDYLGEESNKEWKTILNLTKVLNISVEVNPCLVRGLDYYNGLVFEIIDTSNNLGSQNALGGGGRYDNLSEQLGGGKISAFGFAGGVERLILALNLQPIKKTNNKIGLITTEEQVLVKFLNLKNQYPELNIDINYNTNLGFKKMFKRADKNNCTKVVIVGANELDNNCVKVKDMVSGLETTLNVSIDQLNLRLL